MATLSFLYQKAFPLLPRESQARAQAKPLNMQAP